MCHIGDKLITWLPYNWSNVWTSCFETWKLKVLLKFCSSASEYIVILKPFLLRLQGRQLVCRKNRPQKSKKQPSYVHFPKKPDFGGHLASFSSSVSRISWLGFHKQGSNVFLAIINGDCKTEPPPSFGTNIFGKHYRKLK